MRPGPYRADLRFVYTSPYVRTTTTRGHGGVRGGMPPPAETAGAKIRANCGVGVRLSCSPRHPRVQPANEFTEACPTTFCLFPFPSRRPLAFVSLSSHSLLTFVTMRCVGFLTVPVFAISIARFCRDACDASRVLSLTYIGRIFLYPPRHLRYLLFLNLSFSLAFDKILSPQEPSSYNTKLRFLI